MTVYLDTSILVALFTTDALSKHSEALLESIGTDLVVSDFGRLEFSSAMARFVRTGELSRDQAQATFLELDVWLADSTLSIELAPADIRMAQSFLRRLDLNLRGPDAVHIAISQRIGARLATFDKRMADCAHTLAVELVSMS